MSVQTPSEEALFSAALERVTPQERIAFIEQACAGDEPLRLRLLELLAAHDASQGPLDAPPPGLDVTLDSTPERTGTRIGPYKLLQVIGEGGMGVVYMAEQQEPVERRVALKIIKPGMDSRQVIARFEAERQALALMDHPNIAKVLDAGTVGEPGASRGEPGASAPGGPPPAHAGGSPGRPYFVMELVKGVPITKYCDEKHLTLRERLELFVPVCQAIQHAHQKGIIHRDIKPTNVLIALYDGVAVPKVIDFGIAKATSQNLTEKTMFTEFGQVVGTLEYMSPEQAELNQLDIDTRSDIYSLGVLLYELLTGSTPLDKKRLRSAAFDEMLRIIREEEPQRPSTRIGSSSTLPSIAANRHIEPAKLTRLVRGELDWIVMKALEKDRSRRYETANGLALDLGRYLTDEPVLACPPSAGYRFRKFVRRHRAAAITVTLVAAALVLGLAVSLCLAVLAVNAERLARDNAARAVARESDARAAAAAEKVALKAAVDQRKRAESAETQAKIDRDNALAEGRLKRRHLYAAQLLLAHQAIEQSQLPTAADLLDRQQTEKKEDDLRSFEWHYLWQLCHSQRLEINAECGTVTSLSYSPDGQAIYAKGADFNLRKFDVATGRPLWTVRASCQRGAADLMVGENPATVLSREQFGAVLLDAATGKELAAYKKDSISDTDNNFQLVPGGKTIAAFKEGGWQSIDISDGSIKGDVETPAGFSEWTFSADGKLAAGLHGRDRTLAVLDLATGNNKQFKYPDPGYWTLCVALSPDGQRAVIGTWNYNLHWYRIERSGESVTQSGHSESGGTIPVKSCFLLDTATGQVVGQLEGHSRGLTAVAFSPDGRLVATASIDATVRLWDAETGQSRGTVGWHREGVSSVAFSPDSRELASGGQDGTIKFWPLVRAAEDRAVLGPKAEVQDLAISPDGKTVAVAGSATGSDVGGAVWLLDATSGKLQRTIDQEQIVTSVAFHPTEPILAWTMEDQVTLWHLLRGEATETSDWLNASPDCVRFTSAGLLVASDDDRAVVWDSATKQEVRSITYDRGWYQWPVVSPDGRWLAFADWRYARAHLFSLLDGTPQPPLGTRWDGPTPGASGGGIGEHTAKGAFSPDGSVFAFPARSSATGAAGKVELISVADGKVQASLPGQSIDFLSVAWSPDGRTVATGTRDGAIAFWDPATGEQRMRLAAHQGQVSTLAFTRDGSLLVSGAWDGTVAFHRTK